MQISFDCPKCLNAAQTHANSQQSAVECPHCGWSRAVDPGDFHGEMPEHCLVCGCQDLWRQKDFDPRLGVLIVGVGVLLSTIAVAYMRPGLSLIILMAFGMADWVLYLVLPDRLVCYRCHARYRRMAGSVKTQPFDLELNERYRQEAIRLKQAENTR